MGDDTWKNDKNGVFVFMVFILRAHHNQSCVGSLKPQVEKADFWAQRIRGQYGVDCKKPRKGQKKWTAA